MTVPVLGGRKIDPRRRETEDDLMNTQSSASGAVDRPEIKTDGQAQSESTAVETGLAGLNPTERKRRPGQRGAQRKLRKQQVTLRLDPEVLAFYRAQGQGWQTALNNDLRKLAQR